MKLLNIFDAAANYHSASNKAAACGAFTRNYDTDYYWKLRTDVKRFNQILELAHVQVLAAKSLPSYRPDLGWN